MEDTPENLNVVVSAQPPGLNRVVMSQLTQLFLTATLECPFYEVQYM